MKRLFPLFCLFAAGGFLVSCWIDDDQSGLCRDQLTVEINTTGRKDFSPGEYRFEVKPTGEKVRRVTCEIKTSEKVVCSSSSFDMVVLEGGAVLRLVFFAAPVVATISVWREGRLLGEQVFAPDYFQVTPNGPMEDPVCLQATVLMTVAAP